MDEILAQLYRHGSLIVGFNVLLQQLGLPIPAVPTMMVAGALAAAERINGIATFLLSVGASLVADLVWFWAGRRYGYPCCACCAAFRCRPTRACARPKASSSAGASTRWSCRSSSPASPPSLRRSPAR